MAFVKEAEALIERGQAERLRGEEGMRTVWYGRVNGKRNRKNPQAPGEMVQEVR